MRQESSGGFRAYAGMKSVFVNFFAWTSARLQPRLGKTQGLVLCRCAPFF